MANRERPIVVVTQTQSQTQNGGCGGSGCAGVVGVLLLFGLIAGAIQGEYGVGGQIAVLIGAVVVILGVTATLDQKFGWGLAARLRGEEPEVQPQASSEDTFVDNDNYGGYVAEEPEEELPVQLPPTEHQGVSRPDVYEQILRLAELREKGLITSEEFEAKKRELLDRI